MKAALVFAIIGLIGCLYGLYKGIMKEKMIGVIVNIIFIFTDLFVIGMAIGWDKPNEVKYKTIDDLQSVQVDSVFTKTKMGVDTTYTIHYVHNPFWAPSVEYNVKYLEIDTVFTKSNKCVDTTYVIKYSKR